MNILLAQQIITHLAAFAPPADITGATATAPPGSGGLLKTIGWALWAGFAVGVVGVVKAGGGLALVGIGHGGGGNHGVGFAMAIIGTVIVGSAAGIVTAVSA